jgi:SulP family sulfate permease
MTFIHGLHFDNLRGDLFGGLTAAVVALPLALAFGVASGAGPAAGLYGAIFVGLFAALFGGTPAQVSGPTGPMTVVMTGVITQYAGEPALAFSVVMMAGAMQIAFGAFKLGRYIALVPYPVISGFMTGIGVIIIILQLGPLVGHAAPVGGVANALAALPGFFAAPVWHAAAVGLAALGIAWLTPAKIARFIPPPLIALVVGTLLVFTFFDEASTLGEIPAGLPAVRIPVISLPLLADMIMSAFVLALLGSIDSLLTSLVADSVTKTHHHSDRELVGQGVGNMIAGLFGAIPGAGATMRTVANVRAGGRTPLSGALHALVLLAVALGLGPLAAHIPHAVLAGILIKVGIDIIDWSYLGRIGRAPTAGIAFMLIVAALTVFVDLITAVGVGIVLASLLLVKRMADLQIANTKKITGDDAHIHLDAAEAAAFERCRDRLMLIHIEGPMSFGAAKEMARKLGAADQYAVMVLDLSDVPFIDSTSAIALDEVIRQARERRKPVLMVGLCASVRSVLEKLDVLDTLGASALFDVRLEALDHAAELISGAADAGDDAP